jgi:GntR family transcriptional regulator
MDDPRIYMRIAADLRAQIQDGRLKPGEPVPSIARLRQETGISRKTISKGIRVLADEGLISQFWGRGLYVTDPGMVISKTMNEMRASLTQTRHPAQGAHPAMPPG